MQQYRVTIKQPVHGETFYREAPGGLYNKNPAQARRFRGYQEALSHMAGVLRPSSARLHEPVTITIEPVPQEGDSPWTVEEILAREG
jgi:hypothetical protein